MDPTTAPGDNELRHAEYALGVLDAEARAAVEQEMRADPQAARAVALWQQHLAPLGDDIPSVAPAPYVWARIRSDLGLADTAMPAAGATRINWWDSLRLWRWVGLGASAVAAAAVTLMLTQPHPTPAPTPISQGYMVASIEQDNGIAGWTATMDLQHHRMLVVPATPAALASGRDTELWLIPPGGQPLSLGVIARDKPTSLNLRPDLLAQLSASAQLAVSVEPRGGSPTGQPTGPVVAKGAISGV